MQNEFYKFSGAGNDFVIVDNRGGTFNRFNLKNFSQIVCNRRFGVGADGFILLETSKKANIKSRIFNSDGSETPFCGNGLRCLARFAFMKVITSRKLTIETVNQVVDCEVLTESDVLLEYLIQKKKPYLMEISIEGKKIKGYFVDSGVPHFIIFVKDIEKAPVLMVGKQIRFSKDFGEDGTNVDFVFIREDGLIYYRTYERGVESETLACGSGAVAIGYLFYEIFKRKNPFKLVTSSKKIFEVSIAKEKIQSVEVSLRGEASFVYKGYFSEEFLQKVEK